MRLEEITVCFHYCLSTNDRSVQSYCKSISKSQPSVQSYFLYHHVEKINHLSTIFTRADDENKSYYKNDHYNCSKKKIKYIFRNLVYKFLHALTALTDCRRKLFYLIIILTYQVYVISSLCTSIMYLISLYRCN